MHTATVFGRTLWVFGGESCKDREVLGDLYMLDLVTLEWTKPQTLGKMPPVRIDRAEIDIAHSWLQSLFSPGNLM